MSIVVVVLPDIAEDLLEAAPDGVEVVAWDGRGRPPPAATRTDLWAPPYGVAESPDRVRDALSAMHDVRVVQLLSAGVEPWAALVPPQVTLCSGQGVHGGSTAELAVALVLASVRDLPTYAEQQRGGQWERHVTRTMAGVQVLVLGAGDIGGRVGAVLGALEAEVTLVGRRAREGVRTLGDLPGLVPTTEVLLVALPLTDETRGIIDAALLARLPDGALVVNVARGAIIDTDALVSEVANRRLRAALDVTEPEPLPTEHPLWKLPGVVITPHVGGGATGWEARARDLVLNQVTRLRDGRDLRNVVSDGY